MRIWTLTVLIAAATALSSCSDTADEEGAVVASSGGGTGALTDHRGDEVASGGGGAAADEPGTSDARVADAPVEPWRRQLLEVAYAAASKFPLVPHEKNRARAQEAAAITALEIEQPTLANRFYSGIENWRRGVGYADLAAYEVERGDTSDAAELLAQAADVAKTVGGKEGQDWRREFLHAKIARVYVLLGDEKSAGRYGEGISEAQSTPIATVRASRLAEKDYGAQLEHLDAILNAGSFDAVGPAMRVAVELYDRFYSDDGKRAELRRRVSDGFPKYPGNARLGDLESLAEVALEHEDGDEAAGIVERMVELVTSARWRTDYEVAEWARVACLRFRAGRPEEARTDLARAISLFEDNRSKIESIDRAGALRPIAEAFHQMNDPAGASRFYMRALEEGVVNPNSRPRCDDLVATLCSMVRQGFEPGEEIGARIEAISDGLSDPW